MSRKGIAWGAAAVAAALGMSLAYAQSYDYYVTCEGGHYNSFKACEAVTSYPAGKRHQWWGDQGVILSSNCFTGGRFCSVYCDGGISSGSVYVNFINSSGQLLGTASKSIGCRQ